MNILGIIGLILIIKSVGIIGVVELTMPLFKLFNTIKNNLTIKGLLIKSIKNFLVCNYRFILMIILSVVVVGLICYLFYKRKMKDCEIYGTSEEIRTK